MQQKSALSERAPTAPFERPLDKFIQQDRPFWRAAAPHGLSLLRSRSAMQAEHTQLVVSRAASSQGG